MIYHGIDIYGIENKNNIISHYLPKIFYKYFKKGYSSQDVELLKYLSVSSFLFYRDYQLYENIIKLGFVASSRYTKNISDKNTNISNFYTDVYLKTRSLVNKKYLPRKVLIRLSLNKAGFSDEQISLEIFRARFLIKSYERLAEEKPQIRKAMINVINRSAIAVNNYLELTPETNHNKKILERLHFRVQEIEEWLEENNIEL